jgi:hypothetical protein
MNRWATVVFACWSAVASADLFSPGELSKAHHELEGLKNCTQCHPAGEQLSQAACLGCHTEFKPRVAKGLGFHGRLGNEQRNCENCHKEHQGLAFDLIDWGKAGKKAFEHQKTGWPLKGKHQPLECALCHEPRLIFSPTIRELTSNHPSRKTFLGLKTECSACHFDEHRGQAEGDCEYCHTEATWKPAPLFNHANSDYPLQGKHKKVACNKCHPSSKEPVLAKAFPAPVSETFMKFSPLEHRGCVDCHDDVHEGKFGARCTSCHTVQGWQVIRGATQERAFHEKTRYPLKGAHLEAPCQSCHGPFPGRPARFRDLKFQGCSDCHVDAHQGQLSSGAAAKGKLPDCATCHGVDGFLPVNFSLEAHQKTRYPLEGAHAVVPCTSCHVPTQTLLDKVPAALRRSLKRDKRLPLFSQVALDIKKPLEQCESCHQDVHKGQFAKAGLACEGCHQPSSFTALKFDHQKTRFPLEGAHHKVECGACHAPAVRGAPARYKPLDTACASCHADVHAGQFEAGGKKPPCERCHGNESFKATLFAHQPPFTDFVLDGRHAQVGCEKCHLKVAAGPRITVQRFRGVPTTCEGCHSDFHKGEFKGFSP